MKIEKFHFTFAIRSLVSVFASVSFICVNLIHKFSEVRHDNIEIATKNLYKTENPK